MHYSVLVITAPVATDAVEEEVERLMAPHEERWDEANDRTLGEWDYWRIGGRWAGLLAVPSMDADHLCGPKSYEWGYGEREWPNLDAVRCDGARKQDVDFEAIAVRQIAEARDRWARRDEPGVWLRKSDTEESLLREASHFLTVACLTEEHGWEAREVWDGDEWVTTEGWHSILASRIRSAAPDQWLVVVDVHS